MKSLRKSMIQRCHNPRNPSYRLYGARGITVCDRWRRSYEAFAADVGPRPAGTCLDRIDNTKGYEPGNVRWATMKEQHRNRRDNAYHTLNGETLCLTDWAARYKVDRSLVDVRMRRLGWSLERALTTPPDHRFNPTRVTEHVTRDPDGLQGKKLSA